MLRRSCLRPSADEAPRRTREKTSGTQGKILPVPHESSLSLQRYKNANLMASLIQLNQFTASIFDLEYKSKDLSLHVICNEIKKGKHYNWSTRKQTHFRCSLRHLFVLNRLPWREPQHRKYLHSLLSLLTLAPIHNQSAVTHDGTGKSCVQWIV